MCRWRPGRPPARVGTAHPDLLTRPDRSATRLQLRQHLVYDEVAGVVDVVAGGRLSEEGRDVASESAIFELVPEVSYGKLRNETALLADTGRTQTTTAPP